MEQGRAPTVLVYLDNWRGRPLRTYETVIGLISNTRNRGGLGRARATRSSQLSNWHEDFCQRPSRAEHRPRQLPRRLELRHQATRWCRPTDFRDPGPLLHHERAIKGFKSRRGAAVCGSACWAAGQRRDQYFGRLLKWATATISISSGEIARYDGMGGASHHYTACSSKRAPALWIIENSMNPRDGRRRESQHQDLRDDSRTSRMRPEDRTPQPDGSGNC